MAKQRHFHKIIAQYYKNNHCFQANFVHLEKLTGQKTNFSK